MFTKKNSCYNFDLGLFSNSSFDLLLWLYQLTVEYCSLNSLCHRYLMFTVFFVDEDLQKEGMNLCASISLLPAKKFLCE